MRQSLTLLGLLFVIALLPGKIYGEEAAIHGQEWAFGQSSSREDALWQKGICAEDISKNALPRELQKDPGAMNTSGGINRALNEASKSGARGSVGMSMAHETSTWKARPDKQQVDEFMPRDRRHVLRAFADLKAGEDLDIRVGPELILKDESKGEESANEKQPDSSIGLGMQFKLDF